MENLFSAAVIVSIAEDIVNIKEMIADKDGAAKLR